MNRLLFFSSRIVVTALFGSALFLSPALVLAEEANPEITALRAQISSLLSQITLLKQQIAEIQTGTKPVPPVPDVEPPTTSPPLPVQSCPRFTENLSIGKKDSNANGQVSQLQKFLAQDKSIYPEGSVSGFFGPLTRDAVKRWQLKHGVLSPGSSESAGHGMVGPQTRSALTIACKPAHMVPAGGELVIEPSSAELNVGESVELHVFYQPPMPPCPEGFACAQGMPERVEVSTASFISSDPAVATVEVVGLECATVVERLCEQNRVFVRATGAGDALITASYAGSNADSTASVATMKATVNALSSGKDLPPSIRGVSGPVSLRAGASGTWEVKASDPENQPLSYSVVWGDERVFASSAMPGTRSEKAIEQTSSFTHTYNDGGLYRPVFTVRDSAGNEEHTSMTVSVTTAPSTQGILKVIVSDYDSAPVIYCIQAPCPQPPRNTLDYTKVSLYNSFGQFVRSAETKDGTLIFDELHPGVYIVKASAPGYTEGKESVVVAAGRVSFLEVALRHAVTPPPSPVGGSLSISPPHATIALGASHPVKAIFTPARPGCLDAVPACKVPERAPYEVHASFVSDNPKIALVETAVAACALPAPGTKATCPLPINFVRGVSPGDTTITASYTEDGRTHAAKMKVMVTGVRGGQISITTYHHLKGDLGQKFSADFSASGGRQPYRWEITAGSVPPGLALVEEPAPASPCYIDAGSGVSKCPVYEQNRVSLQGVPTQVGAYKFTLTAKDQSGAVGSATFVVSISSGTSGNNPPNIVGVTTTPCEGVGDGSCRPLDVQPGKAVSFVYSATDADGDNLSWSFDWGDGLGGGSACAVPATESGAAIKTVATSCGWNVAVDHAWQKAGTYTIKAVASDSKGGTDTHSFTQTVGSGATPAPSVTVLSPNGGEWWLRGMSRTITWKSSAPTVMVDLIRPGFEYHLTGPTGDITNTGSLNITVPGTVPDGNDYRIRVMYRSNAAVVSEDTSDSPFSIIGSTGNSQAGKVTVLVGGAGPARDVKPGEQGIQFAKVQMSVSENDVYLNGIHVSSDSAAADTKIQNVRVFDGATEIGSGAPSLIYNGSYYYSWVNSKPPLYISAGTSKVLTVVADITASAGSGPVRVGVAGLNFDSPGATVLNLPAYENTMNVARP